MKSNKRILATAVALLIAFVGATNIYAAQKGTATIGFSIGSSSIYYIPAGVSGVEATLDLNFGTSSIGTSNAVEVFPSLNKAGYSVANESGGASGYTVTLGLSRFDNGLEGATLTLKPDAQGLVSDSPVASSPPILMLGMSSVELEADGLSSVVMLEGKKASEDPNHMALGRWGFNFTGDLKVYTSTIRAGTSRAVMTWELVID